MLQHCKTEDRCGENTKKAMTKGELYLTQGMALTKKIKQF
jgi:hypothetical protein